MQEIFSQNPVYLILAIFGTTLYLLKMLLFIISGDGDIDSDGVDFEGDFADDGGAAFSLVSTQSILAFLMGAGWIGLAAQREWHLNDFASLVAAVLFGSIMMIFSSYITFQIKKFNYIPKTNLKEAIGTSGRAYTNIPAKSEGIGQVEVTVGGKQQIMQASSVDGAIKSFESIKVVEVDDSGNLVVKKS